MNAARTSIDRKIEYTLHEPSICHESKKAADVKSAAFL